MNKHILHYSAVAAALTVIMLGSLSLTACSSKPAEREIPPKVVAWRESYKAAEKAREERAQVWQDEEAARRDVYPSLGQLERQGIQVVHYGNRLRLIVPSDDFFNFNTVALKPEKRSVMFDLADVLQRYTHAKIYVTGYADNVGAHAWRLTRAQQEANNVAAYLWSHGVSRTRLEVKAYGRGRFVASNRTSKGSAANRRVEIVVNPHRSAQLKPTHKNDKFGHADSALLKQHDCPKCRG